MLRGDLSGRVLSIYGTRETRGFHLIFQIVPSVGVTLETKVDQKGGRKEVFAGADV